MPTTTELLFRPALELAALVRALDRLVARHDVIFALTHPYAAYPMVKQARALDRMKEFIRRHATP